MKTLVCFGDSITSEEFNEDGSKRLTSLLREELKNWTIWNAGVPAETTQDGLARIHSDVLDHHPDAVTVLFGANDASDHRFVPLSRYKKNLIQIIESIGAEKVILISPAPVNEVLQKARTNERMNQYAQAVKELSQDYSTQYVPLFEEMSQTSYESFLMDDGLHFNGKGYIFLCQLVLKKFQKSLQEKELS